MKTPMNEPITMFKKQFNFLSMAVHPFPNSDLLSYLYNIQYHLSLIITIPTALVSFQV